MNYCEIGGKYFKINAAGVVELADAPDSKSGGGNPVRVRFSPPAPSGFQQHKIGNGFSFHSSREDGWSGVFRFS